MFKKNIMFLISFFILGCSFSSHSYISPYPKTAYQITPDPIYLTWYLEVEECLKKINIPLSQNNNFNDIGWYIVPGRTWIDVSGGNAVFGTYFLLPKHIYFAQDYVPRKLVIKHEIQHYLLRDFYDSLDEHPVPPFLVCEIR